MWKTLFFPLCRINGLGIYEIYTRFPLFIAIFRFLKKCICSIGRGRRENGIVDKPVENLFSKKFILL